MKTTSATFGLSIITTVMFIGAVFSIIKFRKKVRLIRSLSDNREFDVYVPYNMLFYGFSHLNYRPKYGMAFPHDEKNKAVDKELRDSWIVSLNLILTTWFAIGGGFLALISYFTE